MKFKLLSTAIAASLLLSAVSAMAAKPESETDQFSYALGFQIGTGFKRDNLEVNPDVLAAAIKDIIQGKDPQLSMVEMRSVMTSVQQKMQAARTESANKTKSAGEAFLAANKNKNGVTTLESGVQYKVITSGSGKQPKATDSITANYQGALINGTVFDSSYKRGSPATFGVSQVISGWTEILQLMHEGDKWQVFIPSDLAYGERGAGQNIGPHEALIFDIELISIN